MLMLLILLHYSVSMLRYVYIYIYRERERERYRYICSVQNIPGLGLTQGNLEKRLHEKSTRSSWLSAVLVSGW